MKYFFSVLATFKNEEMIIKEWIDHYMWQGADHFYLIDNGSDDNYLEIIQPYIDKDIITLYYLPEKYKQVEHYNTVFKQIKDDTEWLAVIDIDEYIYNINSNKNIKSFIKKNISYNIIRLYWYRFGSNGYDKQPESVRKSFTYRIDDKCGKNHQSKSILRTSHTKSLDVHTHIPKNIWLYSYTEELRINHYQIMSKEYFQKSKMIKGDVRSEDLNNKNNIKYFEDIDANAVTEDIILKNLVIEKESIKNEKLL